MTAGGLPNGALPVANEAPDANQLLAALGNAARQQLLTDLELLALTSGEILHEPGAQIRHVYFPTDCTIALLATTGARHFLGIALIGYEGMTGTLLALGVNVSTVRALVQTPGTAIRMAAPRFQDILRQSIPLQHTLNRYAAAELTLARQSAACHTFHSAEQRLARWLLMTSDRVRSRHFFLTQAFVANILGVRRVTVTVAARTLQRRRLIDYKRGAITILNRAGLETASCRCYTRIERGCAGDTF